MFFRTPYADNGLFNTLCIKLVNKRLNWRFISYATGCNFLTLW
jgi:hypothetical protein